MTNLFRVRTELTGFIGAPGVATMYFRDVTSALSSVHDLWANIATTMPSDVHIQVIGFGDVIDDVTGDLVATWTQSNPAAIVGTVTGTYSAPVGLLLRWSTDTVVDGHRLRGRTFVVPCGSNMFGTDGQVIPANVVGLQTAISAFQTAQNASFAVWHRPKFGPVPSGGGVRPRLRDGSNGLVTGTGISTKAVVLRSRRD